MDDDNQGWNNQLPWNPYENMPFWPLFLTKDGRQTLKWMFGFGERPQPTVEVHKPNLQYVTCCHDWCIGLVARDGHCSQCNQKFAALIICPKCGWKQGVLNADKYDFKCWHCHAHVAEG